MEKLSVSGNRWALIDNNIAESMKLAQMHALPEVVASLLASRGVASSQVPDFLEPNLKQLPDPDLFKDMDVATERLVKAIKENQKIAIFGDYDVDGSCATAILVRYFRALGLEPLLYIPDRLSEGYGPNPLAFERLKEQGADVVITVDCGSVAFAPMARAKELGLDVIVTDHHQTETKFPDVTAVVNPNRFDESGEFGYLCGAAVAFILTVSINRSLREAGHFTEQKEPNLTSLLDLVAVATVCDVVPLIGVNRMFVERGLKMLCTRRNLGLRALSDVSEINERPRSFHLGFMIGPRINAGGRISKCTLGAELLSTTSEDEAEKLAKELNRLNTERREIEALVLEQAEEQAEVEMKHNPFALVLSGEGWHPGVIGIVASRIKDKYNRPTFIIGLDGEVGKGSGRSVSGIDLGQAVMRARNEGILVAGGGHKMAAGLTLETEKLAAFRDYLQKDVEQQAGEIGLDAFIPRLKVDALLSMQGAKLGLLDKLEQLEPFGMGNPEPRFVVKDAVVGKAVPMGDGSHLRLHLTDVTGQHKLTAIAFKVMDSDLGPYLMGKQGQTVTLLGQLKKNVWNGYASAQFQLIDAWDGIWNG